MGLLSKAFTPLTDLPSRAAKKVSGMISPENQQGSALQGFFSGATEGAGRLLSDMTSPASLAMMAMGPTAGLLGRGLKAAAPIAKAAAPTMDLLESLPVKQVAGSMDDVGALLGDLQRNLARVPNARRMMAAEAPSTAATMPAEMTAIGQEAGFNAPRIANAARQSQSIDDIAQRAAEMSGKRRPFTNVPRQATPLRSAYGR